jgi:hypothetical protein
MIKKKWLQDRLCVEMHQKKTGEGVSLFFSPRRRKQRKKIFRKWCGLETPTETVK